MAFKIGASLPTAHASKQPLPTMQPPEHIKEDRPSSQSQSDSKPQCQAQPRPSLERTRTLSFSEPIHPSRSKDRSCRATSSYSSRSQPGTLGNDRSNSPRRPKTRSPSPYPKPQRRPSDDEDEESDGDWKPYKLFSALASRIRNG
ncbi:hypothetical protein DM02DRAFT_650877 [Periconia macrospinosa]|uniref:Uncharacterized protein n=1 Tax=Periconia macrospinosa TaxID=97972 RepID=A0A2V1E7E2_9PLEO|nr:hypothetical protein DM02DRAFT_650877 [Periconia macrospinosa]